MTKVVAIEAGHDGRYFRQPGEEFEVDLNNAKYKGATWFAPKDKVPVKVVDPNTPPPGAGPKKGSSPQPGVPDGLV